ncbi:hypothetical protein M9458_025933, partial [Cirrhinus mrigala]
MSLCEEKEEKDVVHDQNKRAASPGPSCVSMRSDGSMPEHRNFSTGSVNINP